MKKILIVVAITFLTAGTVYASEMIVQLKSGNTLTIEYSGAIESVTLQGDSDSIIGMKMNVAEQQGAADKAIISGTQNPVPATASAAVTPVKEEKKSSAATIRWARPIDDENLKTVRSR